MAGCIAEFLAQGGKRVIWASVSPDLKYDAKRDLDDLGLSVPIYPQGHDSLPKGSLSLGERAAGRALMAAANRLFGPA